MPGWRSVGSNRLRIVGGFVAIFSLVMSLLVLFAIPSGCIFVGNLQWIILSFLFLGGIATILIGETLSRKKEKVTTNSASAFE
jgi:hypothetical protein